MMHNRIFYAFVSFCWLSSLSCYAGLVDKIVAVVNNEVILFSEVETFNKTIKLRKELDPILGLVESADKTTFSKDQIIDFLIKEKLVTQTFKVSDAELDQQVQDVQRNNNLDKDQLVQFLANQGFEYNQYIELMRVGLAKRSLLDREIRSRVNISEDDIKNSLVHKNIKKKENVSIEYSIQLITIQTKSYRSNELAEQTAQTAVAALKKGEAFTEVAKRLAEDTASNQTTDLGYVNAENLAEPLKSAVKKLKISEISPVLKTADTLLIARLVDIKVTDLAISAEEKENIRESLAKDEYRKQFVMWTDRAQNNAFVKINKD